MWFNWAETFVVSFLLNKTKSGAKIWCGFTKLKLHNLALSWNLNSFNLKCRKPHGRPSYPLRCTWPHSSSRGLPWTMRRSAWEVGPPARFPFLTGSGFRRVPGLKVSELGSGFWVSGFFGSGRCLGSEDWKFRVWDSRLEVWGLKFPGLGSHPGLGSKFCLGLM